MSMLKEFRDFAVKGNVIDLAVGVIIGAAFGKIVDSVVKDLIMPIVGSFGSVDFKEFFVVLSKPASYSGPMTYDALTKAGVPLLAYGISLATGFCRCGPAERLPAPSRHRPGSDRGLARGR